MEACASSGETPIDVRTCEGASEADVQAEPDETATSFMLTSSASPSTPAKDTLRLPGSRRSSAPGRSAPSASISGSGAPFNDTPSIFVRRPSQSRLRRRRSRLPSSAISSTASSAARPSPTIPGTFSVPERMPRSCPPPKTIGSSRTWGLRDRA